MMLCYIETQAIILRTLIVISSSIIDETLFMVRNNYEWPISVIMSIKLFGLYY